MHKIEIMYRKIRTDILIYDDKHIGWISPFSKRFKHLKDIE